ncbi:hypothetical protein GCM10022209_43520 [Chitinophaga oryziterrae]
MFAGIGLDNYFPQEMGGIFLCLQHRNQEAGKATEKEDLFHDSDKLTGGPTGSPLKSKKIKIISPSKWDYRYITNYLREGYQKKIKSFHLEFGNIKA